MTVLHSPLRPENVPAPRPEAIPRLEAGDRLTRAEFERRYDAMPNLKKAELIEGVVYMPSPVRVRHHGNPHCHLIAWFVGFESDTPGTEAADNSSVRMNDDNMPQPDVMLFISPEHQGQAKISQDDYLEGAPELVAEVAASSASYDLHSKLNVYRRAGVREYIVWRVIDRAIDWFVLRNGQYERLQSDAEGIVKSEAFPGLWLDPGAMIAGNLPRAMAVLQQGLQSPEHAAFVCRLVPNPVAH